ncbi:hypothetical protein ACQ4LE_003696 [Meloidogyne hapla]|uniref:SEFIR domain-containing protein n=1 Tax=Meloidogyne hapla TaxID=6305 RepID=A0A1I8BX68_MELHA
MQIRIFFLILLFFIEILHFVSNNQCSHNFIVFSLDNQQNNSFEKDFSFLDDSKSCDQFLTKLLSTEEDKDGKSQISNCTDELLEIDLMPYSVFPDGENILPHVKLNLSFAARSSKVKEIYFQFRCLYSPNKGDYLCHKQEILIRKWGRMIWPCRRLKIGDYFKDKDDLAIFFSYTCYNLFSLSQYLLDIFVITNQDGSICRKTLLLTAPLERQLDPKIDYFYTGVGKLPEWSPLIYVDFSHFGEILVNLSPMRWIWPLRDINLSIFSVSDLDGFSQNNKTKNEKHLLISNERIHPQKYDKNSLLVNLFNKFESKQHWRKYWKNVDFGKYILYAFLDNNQCELVCDENSIAGKNCINCPHTVLNFTLFESKYSNDWKRRKTLILISTYVVILLLAAIVITSILFLSLRFWRQRALQRRQPESVELTKRPNVLILYTDDCQQHTDAVMALCNILEENANASCFVDQKEFLQNPTVRPGVWLTEKLDECDFVLTIFSECSQRVMAGQKMAQRRHFSDYFNIAIGFVISKINEIASNEGLVKNGIIHRRSTKRQKGSTHKNGGILSQNTPKNSTSETFESSPLSRLNQFAFARFSYSHPNSIPSFFKSTLFCAGFGSLILPQHIGPLIAWIHGILDLNNRRDLNETEKNNKFEHQADLSPLNVAIEEFKRFELENPNWVNERFDTGKDKRGEEQDDSSSKELPQINQHLHIPNLAEQAEIAERFGLLGLDENDEEIDQENDEDLNEIRNDTGLPQSLHTQRGQKRYELVGRLEDYDSSSNNSLNEQ